MSDLMRVFATRVCQSLRQMIGVPDYDSYVRHVRSRHPDKACMSYEEFFRYSLALAVNQAEIHDYGDERIEPAAEYGRAEQEQNCGDVCAEDDGEQNPDGAMDRDVVLDHEQHDEKCGKPEHDIGDGMGKERHEIEDLPARQLGAQNDPREGDRDDQR